MCWKAMSDPTGVTTPITVMPMPDLAGPENLQKGVTKILLGNGGKIQGTFFFFFPISPTPLTLWSNQSQPFIHTPTSVEISSLLKIHNLCKNVKVTGRKKWQFWSPHSGTQTNEGWLFASARQPQIAAACSWLLVNSTGHHAYLCFALSHSCPSIPPPHPALSLLLNYGHILYLTPTAGTAVGGPPPTSSPDGSSNTL